LAPGGGEVAAASEDGRLVLHDLSSGEQAPVADRLAGLIRYSADGHWLGGLKADGTLALFDRETGTALETPNETISAFMFSPARDRLATCAAGDARSVPMAKVWSLPSLVELDSVAGEPSAACHLDFSADAEIVVVAAPGRDATVVDLRTGWSFASRGGPRLDTATVSQDGSTLTTLHDGEARVWSLDDLRAAVPLPGANWHGDVSYASARELFVRSHKSAALLDRETGTTKPLPDPPVSTGFVASTPPRPTATAGVVTAEGTVWVETLDRGAKVMRPGHEPETVLGPYVLREVVLSPDGLYLHAVSIEGALVTHDMRTGTERRAHDACPSSEHEPTLVRWVWSSRDGSRVAAASYAGSLCVWDAATGDAIVRREAERGQWMVGPELRWAIHDPENTREPARLIDLERGTTTDLPEEARALAVTGKGLVIYEREGLVWAWDAPTGEPWPLVSAARPFFLGAAVAPDDREIVLYGYRGGVRFVALDRPPDASPEAAAALTEIVTRQPAKLP
jgi:WD40 repeat protein